MTWRALHCLALCLLGALCAESAVSAPTGRDYFVAPTGSDGAVGSKAAPWRSLGRALSALHAGDTLHLRGGTYRETVRADELRPGTAERPIVVRAFPGERPVLQGLLRLFRPSYWTFDGLNVQWDRELGKPREHMVKIGDGVGWVFKNAELSGAQSYAALLIYSSRDAEPRDWRVTGCAIHDTGTANGPNRDHLVYVNSGLTGSGGRIDRNLLFNAPNGSGIKLGGPSAQEGGAAGVTVEYNTIVGARQGIIVAWQSRGNTIRRNLIGRTDPKYAAIRGYQLLGGGNVVTENAVFQTQRAVSTDAGYAGLNVAGDNPQWPSVTFDREGAGGLRPGNPEARAYGRYANL